MKASQRSLKTWTDQKWRTSDGKPSNGKKRYLPDAVWKRLSPSEKSATNRAKAKGNADGKQFVKQPKSIARKAASLRNKELSIDELVTELGAISFRKMTMFSRLIELGDPRLKRAGVGGFNKPKRTPNHPTKSHVVVAKSGKNVKTIRFGQQGVKGSPEKKNESASYRKRRESFKARHASNIKKGVMSAAYWADKAKW